MVASDIIFWGTDGAGNTLNWSTLAPSGTSAPLSTLFVAPNATHEMGHAVGLAHVSSGFQRMSPSDPSGGWFNNTSIHTTPPLADERHWAGLLYSGGSTAPADLYMSNVIGLQGRSYPLSTGLNGGVLTAMYPDNSSTATLGDNRARRAQSVRWQFCYSNLGENVTSAATVTATLSTNPLVAGTVPFGSFSVPSLQPGVAACQVVTSVVLNSAVIGTNYFIVFGSGTGANDIARVDRQLLIDP